MAGKFIKNVKSARRGISFSKKIRHRFTGVLFLFLGLILASAFLIWWREKNFTGSFTEALWSVLFTLIGQGEFAASPQTLAGRLIVFLLSVFGVALFGVVFAEVMQRLINSKLREMVGEILGMNECKFEGHVLICGWNGRGEYLIRELLASGREVALIAHERPENLRREIFFVQGNASEREALIRGGVQKARAAIILGEGNDDARTILTGLAIEAVSPGVYTVMELHNPENEKYARYAHVDDILYTDSLIADITAMCTHNEGISAFLRDILSADDDGHSFAAFDVPEEFNGQEVGELFKKFQAEGNLPVALITPPDGNAKASAAEWVSNVNPEPTKKVIIPSKVVCIVKDTKLKD